ncbi:MAG TPA: FAD-binding protein, partial [Gemmatimonadales bacterium]|nr:FAD-binding protein [Gemmatimonadales bacterium]
RTDLDGRTDRAGLWAVGECASTGVHGANRLASNSLLEGLVFADRVARALIASGTVPDRTPPETDAAVPAFPPAARQGGRTADDACAALREEMRQIMTNDVGMLRTETGLLRAKKALGRLAQQVPAEAWRTANQVLTARLITQGALRRRESRGGHRRLDYPPTARAGGAA